MYIIIIFKHIYMASLCYGFSNQSFSASEIIIPLKCNFTPLLILYLDDSNRFLRTVRSCVEPYSHSISFLACGLCSNHIINIKIK